MQGCALLMKVIDVYEFSLYLKPKMVPLQNKRHLCTGGEIRSKSADSMFKAFLDAVALITFTPTGKGMIDAEEDNSWRTFFVEWKNEVRRKLDGKTGLERKKFSSVHRTEINSKPLFISLFILLSYRPMYAYDSPDGTVEYTSLLNDFLEMYGDSVNVTHEKRQDVEQSPKEVLSDFLFFCVLMNTMKCLRGIASRGKFSYLVRILKKNIETYHKYFVGLFKIHNSDELLDDLTAFKEIEMGRGHTMPIFKSAKRARYKMLCNLLREMTSEDFDEIESLFKELFEFKVSEGLEKKINSEMSAFKEHLPKASQNKLDSIARPLENTAYYIDVVDSTQRRIAHDIVKKFN